MSARSKGVTSGTSMSSVGGSPARMSAPQGQEPDSARPTSQPSEAGCGISSTASSAKPRRRGSSSKTWRPGQSGGCPECDEPSGHGDMRRCPWASPLLRWEHGIAENESLFSRPDFLISPAWRPPSPSTDGPPSAGEAALLPTLLATDGLRPLNVRGSGSIERGGGPRLGDALLPMLTASRYGSNQGGSAGRVGPKRLSLEALLPTLTSSAATRGKAARGKNAQGGESLGEALLPTLRVNEYKAGGYQRDTTGRVWLTLSGMLPTMRAADWRSGNVSTEVSERNSRPLPEALGMTRAPSRRVGGCLLDPGWCELFMGFGLEWTAPGGEQDGPPPEYVPLASTRSATRSSRSKRRSSETSS